MTALTRRALLQLLGAVTLSRCAIAGQLGVSAPADSTPAPKRPRAATGTDVLDLGVLDLDVVDGWVVTSEDLRVYAGS